MKTFFRPQTLLSENRFKSTSDNSLLIENNHDADLASAVIVLSHHRDVRVALDDLRDASVVSDRLILMARSAERHSWHGELTTYSCFDVVEEFNYSLAVRNFFWRLFQKGKYLLLISGTKHDVDSASRIAGRRRGHAEVWRFADLLTYRA